MSPVDDIIINKQMPQKKKGKGIIVILFFLLLIILIGLSGAYYWYSNMRETPKTQFFKYIGQTNIPDIIDTEIYYNILEKINSESFETSTTANFTTTKQTDFTENVDVSKFEFTLDAGSDKDKEEVYIGANITYSSNDFFDLKFISNKDSMAIGSNEILDKYIATSKNNLSDSLNRTTGIETEITADTADEEISKFTDNRINLDDEYKTQKSNEYMAIILEKIPEEAVTLTEDTGITINSSVINTNAYTLTLDKDTHSSLTTEILTKLKNDTDFLSKIVTGNSSDSEETEDEAEEVQNITTINPINIESVEGETVEHQTAQEIETEENLEVVSSPDMGELLKTVTDDDEELEVVKEPDTGALLKDGNITDSVFVKLLGALIFNQKLDMTLEELQEEIDDELENLNITEGIKITVYVKDVDGEDTETIKVVAELPDNANLDIEYPESSTVKITFLEDVEEENEDGDSVTKNEGISAEITRTNTDMQTKFNITLNSIEEKKVVKKWQIELTTEGTKTSKTYSNKAIIKYNDGDGDVKINIKNTIDFQKANIVEELTDENAIFVDQLSDEEASALFSEVVTKVMGLYSEKILNMNFIDNNSSSSVVEQPVIEEQEPETTSTSEEDRIAARDALVKYIEEMMNDAQNNEEEFTIKNLELLPRQIGDYTVSAVVTSEDATVKVNGFAFHIDKNFVLTEE